MTQHKPLFILFFVSSDKIPDVDIAVLIFISEDMAADVIDDIDERSDFLW